MPSSRKCNPHATGWCTLYSKTNWLRRAAFMLCNCGRGLWRKRRRLRRRRLLDRSLSMEGRRYFTAFLSSMLDFEAGFGLETSYGYETFKPARAEALKLTDFANDGISDSARSSLWCASGRSEKPICVFTKIALTSRDRGELLNYELTRDGSPAVSQCTIDFESVSIPTCFGILYIVPYWSPSLTCKRSA